MRIPNHLKTIVRYVSGSRDSLAFVSSLRDILLPPWPEEYHHKKRDPGYHDEVPEEGVLCYIDVVLLLWLERYEQQCQAESVEDIEHSRIAMREEKCPVEGTVRVCIPANVQGEKLEVANDDDCDAEETLY